MPHDCTRPNIRMHLSLVTHSPLLLAPVRLLGESTSSSSWAGLFPFGLLVIQHKTMISLYLDNWRRLFLLCSLSLVFSRSFLNSFLHLLLLSPYSSLVTHGGIPRTPASVVVANLPPWIADYTRFRRSLRVSAFLSRVLVVLVSATKTRPSQCCPCILL